MLLKFDFSTATMIRNKTVFVIGAGAGIDVDMPLGSKLSEVIAEKLNIIFSDYNTQESGDRDIVEALRRRATAEDRNVNEYRQAGVNVSKGIGYTRSIDSYLNAHTGDELVKVCAKLAIVHTILHSEKTVRFSLTRPSHLWIFVGGRK